MDARSIFNVRTEINDKGWIFDHHFFKEFEDAEKHLIRFASEMIWDLRKQGHKIDSLHRWGEGNHTMQVSFRALIDGRYNYYDIRIFDAPLWNDYKDYRKHYRI